MTDTDTFPALAANAYHDGYIDGVKLALEMVSYSGNIQTATENLNHMLETITKKETK